jgi:hypothetical protein
MRSVQTLLLAFAGLIVAARLGGAQAPPPPPRPADTTSADEKILRDLKERVDPAALLDYFRKRTYPEANPKKLEVLIRQLGDRSFRVREQARTELIALGPSGMVAVRAAEHHHDHEILRRAVEIRSHIERKADPVAEGAAARLLALHKPEQAAEVLLNFLPFAADDSVIEEICRTLPAVAVRSGKPEPAVVAALKDKLPVKRGAAGAALAKAGAQLPAARALLKDREPTVRLRVALALVTGRRDADAVEALIATFEHLPPDCLWPAEEVLIRLAGAKAPQVSLGTDADERLKCKKAWEAWWVSARKEIDLAKVQLENAFLGYTLLVQRTFNRIVNGKRFPPGGQVQELDSNKKVRWEFDLPPTIYPVHAEVVAPDRVLLAEYQRRCVCERDFKGNVKWEKALDGNPLAAQRLSNGNTFVVMQNRLIEYDRKGTEVYRKDWPPFDIFRARKLRNGHVVFITAAGSLSRIDPRTGKTLVSFSVGPMGSQFGSFEVLPNGHYLIPVYGTREVIEFDAAGKRLWSASVPWPTSVQRLPNGNTLVGSQNARNVIELDRSGREVWRHQSDGQVFMVHRR